MWLSQKIRIRKLPTDSRKPLHTPGPLPAAAGTLHRELLRTLLTPCVRGPFCTGVFPLGCEGGQREGFQKE